jgi:hypothetical protein
LGGEILGIAWLAGRKFVSECESRYLLLWRYEGELLDETRVVVLFAFYFAKHGGNSTCHFEGFVWWRSFFFEIAANFLAKPLRAFATVSGDARLKSLAGADRALQRLA